ncbi:MAG: 50S ribosomal protein L23 [Chitinophagales bacterium]|nr:50S ribosomal protein L23 [Bacteroidota bacterium]MCB9255925.1 50S ribosomal protein L23 [Chitinophagales bacterium]
MRVLEDILVKPLVTEKSTATQEKSNRFSFVVMKGANKLEIKKAIETMYGVSVDKVWTHVIPAKAKTRFTKSGVASGRKPAFKKAIVSLVEGDTIDFYSNI